MEIEKFEFKFVEKCFQVFSKLVSPKAISEPRVFQAPFYTRAYARKTSPTPLTSVRMLAPTKLLSLLHHN